MKSIVSVLSPSEFLRRINAPAQSASTSSDVTRIIDEVRAGGDRALMKLTRKYDGVSIKSVRLKRKAPRISPALLKDMKLAFRRILDYHLRTADASLFWRDGKSAAFGRIVKPLRRVGIYVPGGTAPLFSTLLMAGAAARAAGVTNIAVATPPPVADVILAAAKICGISEIHQVGGAQAIAALSYGTESIEPVDKIVGPGNRFVAEAKRQVFGHVGIDSIAGPSEILILADHTSDPRLIASDLLAQAEHDPDARAMLLTTYRDAIPDIAHELLAQLATLPRHGIARASLLRNGCIVLCENRNQMVGLANQAAPEHLEILTAEPWEIAEEINAAGAIFVGPDAPEVFGDYIAGPNHVLPTSRTARFAAPLSARDFVAVSSIQWFAPKAARKLAAPAARLARAESLEAHARAAEARTNARRSAKKKVSDPFFKGRG